MNNLNPMIEVVELTSRMTEEELAQLIVFLRYLMRDREEKL